MTRAPSRLPRGAPSTPPARIAVCIAMADPLLARRVTSLLSGDMHFKLSFDLDDDPDPDVLLTDHTHIMHGPSIVIDDGAQNFNVDGEVRAVLPPNVDGDVLRAAIRIVSAGLAIFEAHEPLRLADSAARLDRPLRAVGPSIALTARENEVLGLLVHGASNKSIARDLDISIHTAKFHVASLMAKLGARNRSDAVAIAIGRGLVLV